jgi:hypothetical protein
MQSSTNNNPPNPIFHGVDFLLSHLSKPEFPRTIATKVTEGKQIMVSEKIEALAYYKLANYMDCRLAAYPYSSEKAPQVIDFVMLDLDLNNFRFSRQKLDKALHKILSELKNKHDIVPTVIWSGNGYHVLLPLEPLQSTLENMAEFTRFKDKEPSKHILRFLEKYISNKKSDFVHNNTVSFGNCMLRVPGSINTKNGKNQVVSIIDKWNGKRFDIEPLLGDFHAYLIDHYNNNQKNKYRNTTYGNLLSRP